MRFLSTPSARRATGSSSHRPCRCRYFYPRPPRGGRLPGFTSSDLPGLFLSTPSARRATRHRRHGRRVGSISIHALREEGDHARWITTTALRTFLSTPSARRATFKNSKHCSTPLYFYPRPPRGGRHPSPSRWPKLRTISIHALREEGDAAPGKGPHRRSDISIHALREEGDPPSTTARSCSPQFLSTPSARRATVQNSRWKTPHCLFLSTPSARRATNLLHEWYHGGANFYPRPPRGGRPTDTAFIEVDYLFLSTPSARRATAKTEKNSSAFVSL